MHEILLFASVPASQHDELLHQLAGLAAMQPTAVLERRLLFRAFRKPGFIKPRVGGSQAHGQEAQVGDVQRLSKMLGSGMYHLQVVSDLDRDSIGGTAEDQAEWRVEFKDVPDAGAATGVTTRFAGTARLPDDYIFVLNEWGFNYHSEYVVEGNVLVLDDAVLFLHRILIIPPELQKPSRPGRPLSVLPPYDKLTPLDPSGGYVLQACFTIQDSSSPDLLRSTSQRMLALKEQLRPAIRLEPADRLALDPRVKAGTV
ncbi:mediator of RNA polymerase II transcription subunit 18 [Arthroderma uncinatum]|uniref:mediator of RNA polymerase II transcription subunit 18 n=1 Tax=Arthroderma uncinatum TaxID=74035 RepID=UPI00144A5578|nr:mediator of RNA polymerase II transcription subunit 18 [Arthroderma uncinatum]KAF3491856.1 mediator of RNA polymerase II transcription subunit 18 [Arthroderma uncinatum]